MQKIILIFTLLFSTVMFSSPLSAEWVLRGNGTEGNWYVDYESISKNGEYVTYWSMVDWHRPKQGRSSVVTYHQGDCGLYRYKTLSFIFHNQSMGRGTGDTRDSPFMDWVYPPPTDLRRTILLGACMKIFP